MHRGISTRRAGAVIVAAGSGARLGGDVPKALVQVGGRSLVGWCLDAFTRSSRIGAVVVAAPADHLAEVGAVAAGAPVPVVVIAGGASRAESVSRGLDALPAVLSHVLVHDAARPLVTPAMIAAVLDGIGTARGAILAAPLADTLKRMGDDGAITGSPDREGLWCAQTPQAFIADALRDAVARARAAGVLDQATDCSSLLEAAGQDVHVVDTGQPNLKVTTPADLALVEALLALRSEPVVG